MLARGRSRLLAFWSWAQHVDRALFYEDRRVGFWPPSVRAVLGLNWRESWRVRLWWMCVGVVPLGIVLLADPLLGQPLWHALAGGGLIIGGPLVAWRTVRSVYGEAWDATRPPRAG